MVYNAWKIVEDGLRAAEKGRRQGEDDDEGVSPDDATDYTPRHGGTGESPLQREQRHSVAHSNEPKRHAVL
jgi:hypothetical protein